jgi:hypothetical protein
MWRRDNGAACDDRGMKLYERGDSDERPTFESFVLSFGAGEWSVWRLLIFLAAGLTLTGVSASFLYDGWALTERGEIAQARVVRTNYDGRTDTINVVFVSGPVGETAIVERLKQRPAQGEIMPIKFDPKKPSRAVDPQASAWELWDYIFVPLGPAMLVVTWARWNRWRRRRGPREAPEAP